MSPKKKLHNNRWTSMFFELVCFVTISLTACMPQTISDTLTPSRPSTSTQIPIKATPTLTQTARPTSTLTATPTLDVVAALASEFNVPAVCLFAYRISIDHKWIGADCNTSHELIIAQKGTSNKVTITYQEILDKNPVAFTVKPLGWSSDSQYFYFTTATVCCSDYNQHEGNGALYQYDTKNNFWDILIKTSYEPYYFFSDDGERFIYIKQSNALYTEIEIGMVEILTRKSKRVVLKGYIVDNPEEFAWSKSMDKFAIILWELQFRNGTPGSVVLEIDFKKMDMQIIEEFNANNLLGEN